MIVWLYAGTVDKFTPLAKELINQHELYISPVVRLELQYLFEMQRISDDSAQIVAGYNLTNEAVSELQQLLQNRKQVSRMRSICKSWTNTLEEHVKEAGKLGLSDPSITGIDIAAITRMTESYGDAALEQTTKALSVWHQRYRWRTAKEAFSDFTGDSDIEFSPEIIDEQIA